MDFQNGPLLFEDEMRYLFDNGMAGGEHARSLGAKPPVTGSSHASQTHNNVTPNDDADSGETRPAASRKRKAGAESGPDSDLNSNLRAFLQNPPIPVSTVVVENVQITRVERCFELAVEAGIGEDTDDFILLTELLETQSARDMFIALRTSNNRRKWINKKKEEKEGRASGVGGSLGGSVGGSVVTD